MPNKRLDKSLKKTLNTKENKIITFPGELGLPLDGNKLVEVPNRKGYVFVRVQGNMSEAIQAYNSEVSPIYGLPVLIARQNNVYRVIGRNIDLYRDWGNIPYLPRHGGQHSFNHALGMGGDITWVYSQQFMPLLGYPSGTNGSMFVSIVPHFYSWNGQYYYAQTTGTPSFAPYVPTITGSAVMTLLYIRPSDNSLQIATGTPFSNSITGSAELAQYIPNIDRSVGIPIAAVRLVTGTTGITWGNIYDVRDFFTVGQGSSGGGSFGVAVQDEGILLGTGTTLDFVGDNVSASISGSVVRVYVTGSAGGTVNPPVTGTFVAQDEGITLGSATILNVVGAGADLTISGTVARLFVTGTTPSTTWLSSEKMIVDNLTPQVTGSNTNFNLLYTMVSGTSNLFYNGVRQKIGDHYTVNLSQNEVDTLFTPSSPDTLIAVYEILTSGTVSGILSSSIRDYILIQDQKAQNTGGGTFTAGAWQTRTLTTEVSDTGGHASLSSNQITLVAGTYEVRIKAPAWEVNRHQARLHNITDNTVILLGTSEFSGVPAGDTGATTSSIISGKFTITSSKVIEVQHQCQTTKASIGFGVEANLSTEIYTIVEFWKVA